MSRHFWLRNTNIVLFAGMLLLGVRASYGGTLRAGAARIDITPAPGAALPMDGFANRTEGFKGIHDHIYVRAIVLDDGATQAALVAWELLFVPEPVWAAVSRRVADETGIRAENLILAAVHDHGAPSTISNTGTAGSGTTEYTKKVEDAAVEAVRTAKARLQPARFGMGTGKAYLNINRREYSPETGWWLGYNEDGPSDKTVNVLRFDDLTGKPIALLINYPVHAVVMGSENYQVTGDLAGATSRFVEAHYRGEDHPRGDAGPRLELRPAEKAAGDGPVAVWTSGAAGDQNPISMAGGEDFTLVDAMGQMLGEEVLRVAGGIKTGPDVKLHGAQRVITCPGRQVEPGPRPRSDYKFTDSDPVKIRLTLLTIDHVALTGVSGEVFTLISQRLGKELPAEHTVMITHANGSSGYIPDDAAFEQPSYEITTSHLKPGCAERGIIDGFSSLLKER